MGSRDGGDRDPGHARDSRRALGPVISIIALLFLAQLYFGAWLPGRLSHPGMSVERILEFTYSTQEAIAGANPMRTGIAALKFGATLMIIPFSFAYVPELLLIGTPVEIAHAATAYLLGNLALAMGLQGAAFVHGLIAPGRRGLFTSPPPSA